jgi:hypothetical protein
VVVVLVGPERRDGTELALCLFRENLSDAFRGFGWNVPVLNLTSVVVIDGVRETGNITNDKDIVPRVTVLP